MLMFSSRVSTSVGIVDLGISNLGSIEKSISEIADEVVLIRSPEHVRLMDRLIIPGVGAYPTAMERLEETGLKNAILEFSQDPCRAVLGICLGMQILSSEGEEHGLTDGLNLIAGRVRRLQPGPGYRIPHVGWNSVSVCVPHPLFVGINDGADFYFVHSYVFDVETQLASIATCDHGEVFSAAVSRGNIVGVQFHPEKSSVAGRVMLRNFCEWSPC